MIDTPVCRRYTLGAMLQVALTGRQICGRELSSRSARLLP